MLRDETWRLTVHILIACWSLIFTVKCQDACVDKSTCKCTFTNGSVVDLSSLGMTNSNPRFMDVVSPDGNKYSYNPCYGFKEGPECTNAAICLTAPRTQQHYLLASQSDGSFQYEPGNNNLVLHYINEAQGIPVIINLICDERSSSPSFTADGIQESGIYLSLTSKCACIDGCKGRDLKIIGSISAGTVLCIIFFSLLGAYIIGGMVFMRVRRKASGLEMVPNVKLWKSIPGLIKDGVIFTVGRTFRCSSYQKI